VLVALEVDGDEFSASGLLVMALQPLVRDYAGGVGRANAYRDNGGRGLQWVEEGAEGESAGRMDGDTEIEEGETVEGGHSISDDFSVDIVRLPTSGRLQS
jgi:hypothetical protein